MDETPDMGKQTNYANRVIFALCALFNAVFTTCTDEDPPSAASFIPGPRNPFITDRFTADPAAFLDDDGTVYIICGEDALPPVHESNEYFRMPRWHIYSTRDMKKFNYECVLMYSNKPAGQPGFSYGQVNSAWAAQAIKGLDGRYYFYGTVLLANVGYEQSVAVAVADSPLGPWVQASNTSMFRANMVTQDTGNSQTNIDPTVFIDDDGTAWLSWSQVRPRIVKLKENMIEIDRDPANGKKIQLLFPDDWTSEDRYEEGPFLYKRKGIYYLFYASMKVDSNGAAIAETISYAMARDEGEGLEGLIGKSGVWSNGVPITGHAPAPGVNGEKGNSYTIHPAVLDFKGAVYLFYHNEMLKGVPQENGEIWDGGDARRSLAVDYLYFNDDGTIQFVDVRNLAGLSVPPKGK